MELKNLSQAQILEVLTSDSDYYGDFGKQFLSYSSVGTLLKDPANYGQSVTKTIPMVIGGYFHTLICEPEKIDSFKIIDATTRNTNKYKELSEGEMCLLQHEADKIELMREKLLGNDTINSLIRGNVEYEKPAIGELAGERWKGKADIVNHDERLIIDLKTTADISKFRGHAYRYNYDAQAYIYQQLFGYEFVFIAIDKSNLQLGIYDCSTTFLESGREKVNEAVAAYRLFHKNQDFDPTNYYINETL